jgi:hypothetical protein
MLPATRSILYEVGFAAGFCNLRIRATFTLTQEFLSHMLGVRRNTVSVEAHALQQAWAGPIYAWAYQNPRPCATCGHAAAAPPSSVRNWRRLRSSMGSSPEPAVPAYSRLRMP